MNLRAKLGCDDDERAVSPVIGVILMVAITVILAAVIAAFVMDIGDLDESAPSAQYNWESDADNITVTHTSGDNVDTGDLTVTVIGDETNSTSLPSGDFTAGDSIDLFADDENVTVSGDFESQTVYDVLDSGDDISDEVDEVRITWEADGSSAIIADYEP